MQMGTILKPSQSIQVNNRKTCLMVPDLLFVLDRGGTWWRTILCTSLWSWVCWAGPQVLTQQCYWPPLGMVTLPMTFLSNTPLDCTIHHSLWPNSSHDSKIPHHTRFVQSYAKKYCSETHISPFLLYLPFTLLLAPMALTACEKIFIGYQALLLSELCSHYILI